MSGIEDGQRENRSSKTLTYPVVENLRIPALVLNTQLNEIEFPFVILLEQLVLMFFRQVRTQLALVGVEIQERAPGSVVESLRVADSVPFG